MIYSVDTVIIGAGPAGSACAITLQKENISNCVIDKKAFPRSKTCGGLVTGKTLHIIQKLLDAESTTEIEHVFCDKCSDVSLCDRTKELAATEATHPFHFVDRKTFDHYLVSYYRELGGTLLDGNGAYTIDYSNRTISFLNGDKVVYKTLIAADGALSKVRTDLGLKMDRKGFCVETHIPKHECDFKHHIGVHFSVIPDGYAWVFPAGDSYCVGLGGVYSKEVNYKKTLEDFLTALGVSKDYQFMGAYVPYGEVVDASKLPENVILIGDAAGLVDPIYGEGLYFALASGVEAALSIKEKDVSAKEAFLRRIEPYVRIVKQGARLQKVFFHPIVQWGFLRTICGHDNFLKYYCDKQISEYSYAYNQLIKLVFDYLKEGRNNHVDS